MDDQAWFKQFTTSEDYGVMRDRPVVYFCAEYALNDDIHTYAGGLGILAGDIIREAAEKEIPFVAVGLYYHEGYLHNDLYQGGIMMKSAPRISPAGVNLVPVVDQDGKRIIVELPIQEEVVYAQAWSLQIGNVHVYLLDTYLPQNSEENKQITDCLYVSSKELRFKQELVLGLGGLRLLEALKIEPSGYHLNEGHSALLALEIARWEMRKNNRTFEQEIENAKKHIFFSNHTLVPAGNDIFHADLASRLLSGFAKELNVPVDEVMKLGLFGESGFFSMTLLALRMASKANAVSRLHATKAAEIWKDYPMSPITNGIHIKTWDSLANTHSPKEMWEKHQQNKRVLLDFIRTETGTSWDENTLLLGWARRIVTYKRPLSLFENLELFKSLAESSDRPIRVVISGLSHKDDSEGLAMFKHIEQIVKKDLKGLVVYLPDYRMCTAKLLVSGCDVWLNTPSVGFEACGTSGMKAALNGVLPCSTNDGWVAEANLYAVGWLLQNESLSNDILSVLGKQIAPLYYAKDSGDFSEHWVKMMQNARDMTLNQFSATKMLRKYIEEFYLIAIHAHQLEKSA